MAHSSGTKQQNRKDRILGAITKLNDKNTQPGAIYEINKLVEDLDEDGLNTFVAALCGTLPDQKPHARKESVRVVAVLVSTRNPVSNLALENHTLTKLLGFVKLRLKDTDAVVRDTAADVLASVAESLNKPAHKAHKTPATINVLLKVIFDCLGEPRKESQLGGCAAATRLSSHLPPLPATYIKTILKLLANTGFHAKTQLVVAVTHTSGSGFVMDGLMRAGAEVWAPALSLLVGSPPPSPTGLLALLAGQDWNARRAAADALKCILYVYGPFLDTAHKVVGDDPMQMASGTGAPRTVSAELLHRMYTGLDKCRYDKIKPVRDTVIDALDVHSLLQAFVSLGLPHERWHTWCKEEHALAQERKLNPDGASDGKQHRRNGSGGSHARSNSGSGGGRHGLPRSAVSLGGAAATAVTAAAVLSTPNGSGAAAGGGGSAAKPPTPKSSRRDSGGAGSGGTQGLSVRTAVSQQQQQHPDSPTMGTRASRMSSPGASRGTSRTASPGRRSLSPTAASRLTAPTISSAAKSTTNVNSSSSHASAANSPCSSPKTLAALRRRSRSRSGDFLPPPLSSSTAAHAGGGHGHSGGGSLDSAAAAAATLAGRSPPLGSLPPTDPTPGFTTPPPVLTAPEPGDGSPLSFTIPIGTTTTSNTTIGAPPPSLLAAAAARRLGGGGGVGAGGGRGGGYESSREAAKETSRRLDAMEMQGREMLAAVRRLEAVTTEGLAAIGRRLGGLERAVEMLAEGQARLRDGQASLQEGQASLAAQQQRSSPSRVATAVAALTAASAPSSSPRGGYHLGGGAGAGSNRGSLDLPPLRTVCRQPSAASAAAAAAAAAQQQQHHAPTPVCTPAGAVLGGARSAHEFPPVPMLPLHTVAASLSTRDMVAPASPTAAPHVNPMPLPMPGGAVSSPGAAAFASAMASSGAGGGSPSPRPGIVPLTGGVDWGPMGLAAASAKPTAPLVPEDIERLYREAVARGDSFYILRLMRRTGPCWDTLRPSTAAGLLRVVLHLVEGRSAVQRLVPWLSSLPDSSGATRRAMHETGLDVQLLAALDSPLLEQVAGAFTPDALFGEDPGSSPILFPCPSPPPPALAAPPATPEQAAPAPPPTGASSSPNPKALNSPTSASSPPLPSSPETESVGVGGGVALGESDIIPDVTLVPGAAEQGAVASPPSVSAVTSPPSSSPPPLAGGAAGSAAAAAVGAAVTGGVRGGFGSLAAMADQLDGMQAELARLPGRSPRPCTPMAGSSPPRS